MILKNLLRNSFKIKTVLIHWSGQHFTLVIKEKFGFNIFIPIVDYWALYDNCFEAKLIANSDKTVDLIKFAKIKESCQQKKG